MYSNYYETQTIINKFKKTSIDKTPKFNVKFKLRLRIAFSVFRYFLIGLLLLMIFLFSFDYFVILFSFFFAFSKSIVLYSHSKVHSSTRNKQNLTIHFALFIFTRNFHSLSSLLLFAATAAACTLFKF